MSQRVGGWSTPVVLPPRLEDLQGPTSGVVYLPSAVYSSGAGPRTAFDLGTRAAREEMYAVVMENAATAEDLHTWLDAGLRRQMWPTMWLSPHVRAAWAPLLEQAVATAATVGSA